MSATHQTLPPLTIDASIPVRFRQVAWHAPDHLAVVDGDQCITYAKLDAWSERIAQMIAGAVGDQPQPIALHFGQGIPVITAMLGVLKAGHFYAVLDTAMPENRINAVLDNLHSDYLLTDGASKSHHPGMQVVACPGQPEQPLAAGDHAVPPRDALAVIHYTSGATGQPKGVMVDHAMLLHRANQLNEIEPVSARDVVAGLFSPAYSSAAADIYGALLNGATLALYRPAQQSVGDLRDWLITSRVTMLHLHSGILRQLLDVLPEGFRFEHLRYVRSSGRTRVDEVRRLRRHLPPDAIVMHQLTSSETTAVTHLAIRGDDELAGEILPVGYPVEPEQVTLVGPGGQPIDGEGSGEVVVRSRYLARGYWHQPELTAQRFQIDPADPRYRIFRMGDLVRRRADGMFELLGRNDQQVKIRGYTVNLEAVEAALIRLPGVQEAVVAAQMTEHDTILIAYVCADTSVADRSSAALRTALASELPAYMLPARFVFLDTLPRHSNGKVDRQSLPPPGRLRTELGTPFIAPRSDLEQQIADIWAELLELDEVGVEDNFFELGGDSILAMRMMLRAEAILGPLSQRGLPPILTVASLVAVCAPDHSAPDQRSQLATPRPHPLPFRREHGPVALSTTLQWAARQMMLALSYRQGQQWLHWLSQPALAPRLFRQEAEWLRRLASEMDHPAPDSLDILRASIKGNMLQSAFRASRRQYRMAKDGLKDLHNAPQRFWRSFADQLEQTAAAERRQLVQFHGLEHLVHAQKQGRGVILATYHAAPSDLANIALAHITSLGRIPTVSLVQAESMAALAAEEDVEAADVTATWAAFYGVEAYHRLRQGGVVRFASDINYDHPNAIRKQIGARLYQLKPGFAELALLTGAIVLPTYVTCDPAGVIHLSVLPAIQHPGTGGDPRGRVQRLLDQYVGFLNATWRAVPASLGWGALHRYYHRPVAASAIPGPSPAAASGVSR